MNAFLKNCILGLTAALSASAGFSQDARSLKNKEGKSEDIIIHKKGDNTGKMTIVVDGDNVTINGKPAEDLKNEDVTVLRRNRSMPAPPNVRGFRNGNRDFNPEILDQLTFSHSNKAMLGILTEKAENGAKVTDVTKASGAEKAGLKKEDVITKAGTADIKTPQDLIDAISQYKPEDKVDITYLRNGKENKTTATLGENKSKAFAYNLNNNDFHFNTPEGSMPHIENFDFNFNRKPRIGLQIQDVEEGRGVKVKDVDEDSPASKAGMKEGDVITQLNGKDVAGVDDLRDGIKDIKEGDAVKFSYKRDGKNETAEIKIPKRLKSADL